MNIEELRNLCLSLPHVTEDIKWGHDLCFCIGEKMFCITGIEGPLKISFKVKDEEFHDMSSRPNIVPAPYVARYKWVLAEDAHALKAKEWMHFVKQSYELVKANLPKKVTDALGTSTGKKQKNTVKKAKPAAKKTKPAAKKNSAAKTKKTVKKVAKKTVKKKKK